jgi:uncharacterized protein
MKKIGVLSDTHGYLHPRLFEFFRETDELWHAGDIGDVGTAGALSGFKPLKAVYGNIDGKEIRMDYPLQQVFFAERVKVLMTHIGGYPGRYQRPVPDLIRREHPGILVTGHSHILKVMYDRANGLLFINPGAAGINGFHHSITMVRFIIDGEKISDLEVLDIPRKKA